MVDVDGYLAGAWQGQQEDRFRAIVVVGDVATHQLGQITGDGQPQPDRPGAVFRPFAALERFEDDFPIGDRDPYPRVNPPLSILVAGQRQIMLGLLCVQQGPNHLDAQRVGMFGCLGSKLVKPPVGRKGANQVTTPLADLGAQLKTLGKVAFTTRGIRQLRRRSPTPVRWVRPQTAAQAVSDCVARSPSKWA